MRPRRRAAILLLAGALLVPAALPAVERLTFKPGFNLYSLAQDVAVGKQNAEETDKQLPLITDAQVVNYVNNLGKMLVRYEPISADYPWTFKVVNSREINAFAFPGGYIYVNRGAIESAEDEAQLAGVIAHETGHVVMRHGTHMASQMAIAQGGVTLLGGLLGGSSSSLGDLAQLGIKLGVGSVMLHNSRGAESQADEVGTYVLYHAGYDPYAMAQFFQIIEQKYPQRTIQFFSDHPVPENRIKAVDAEIPKLGPPIPGGGKKDSPEFQAVKKKLLAMAPPPKEPSAPQAQQGGSGSSPSVIPSRNFRRFDHSAYSISYPDNWEVFGDANSSVTLAPRAGVSENAVAYGAIVNVFQPSGGNKTLDQATRELVDTLRKADPNLNVAGRASNLKVNGVKAKSTDLTGASPVADANGKPLVERDRLVTLKRRDGSLLYLIFIAPDRDNAKFLPAFNQMLQSLQIH